MQVKIDKFFDNLSETCRTDSLIRRDGKALTLLDRLQHFFTTLFQGESISPQGHFAEVCANLTYPGFAKLNINSQLEILARINELRKTTFPQADVERSVNYATSKIQLTEEKITNVWTNVSQNLQEANKNKNLKQFKHNFSKFDTLVYFALASKDQALINHTKNVWKNLYIQLEEDMGPNKYIEDKNKAYGEIKFQRKQEAEEINQEFSISSKNLRKCSMKKYLSCFKTAIASILFFLRKKIKYSQLR